MTENKKKSAGKNRKEDISMMSRPEFMKIAGVTAAGIGAAAMGLGSVASAQAASSRDGGIATDFDGPAAGRSLIEVIQTDSTQSYAGFYAPDGTVINEGVPELLQKFILSYEQDEETWKQITKKVDHLYHMVKVLMHDLLKNSDGLRARIDAIKSSNQKFSFKPNFVTPLEDIAPAFIQEIQAYNSNPKGIAPCGRGAGWGGSTAWPFMAALLRYFKSDLGIPFDQMIIAEGGDKSEFDVALLSLLGFPVTIPMIFEGRVVDQSGTPVWYGGIGMYFARKYLVEKTGDSSAMNGYYGSLSGGYISPSSATGIMLYNANEVKNGRGIVIDVPASSKPWNDGVLPEHQINSITVHEAIAGDSVGFIINCPKMKVHPLGTQTGAVKNIGIGIPASWAKGEDGLWLYASVPNEADANVPVGKFKIPHETYYGEIVDEYGASNPMIQPDPDNPNVYDPFNHYDVHKTGSMSGYIIDACLALKTVQPNILHVMDAIIAANVWHEASGGGTPPISLVNEGMLFASEDPVALDKLVLRYMYKRIPVAGYGFPERAFWNYAFLSDLDPATGQIAGSFGIDWTTTETVAQVPTGDLNHPFIDLPGSDNKTQWSVEAGLGKSEYYVRGFELDPVANKRSDLGSIRGHLVKIKTQKFKAGGKSMTLPEDVMSALTEFNLPYMTIAPAITMSLSFQSYLKANDALFGNTAASIFPNFFMPQPGFEHNLNSDYLSLINFKDVDHPGYPDFGYKVIHMDDFGKECVVQAFIAGFSQPRDVLLDELMSGSSLDEAVWKAAYVAQMTFTRYCDPYWNHLGQYYARGMDLMLGYIVAFQMAMAPSGVPVDPEDPYSTVAANVDPMMLGMLGRPLIYGNYSKQITHYIDPTNGQAVPLPNPLNPGIYWPSGYFAFWLYNISGVYGDLLSNGDLTGGIYWAASAYAQNKGYTFNLYMPYTLALLPSPLPGVIPVFPLTSDYSAKSFKAEFTKVFGTGDGSTTTFNGNILPIPIMPGSVTVRIKTTIGEDDVELQVRDNGQGALVDDGTTIGTIDYYTGVFTITFLNPPESGAAVYIFEIWPEDIFGVAVGSA